MSVFGSFGAANQNQQQQPTGGLFGTSTQNQPAQNAVGLFGNAQQQQQPQQQTGSLFSNPQQQPTGALFGNAQQQTQQQPTGGLFGNTQQQPQQNAGGGLFGAAAAPNNANNAPSGGLFGNTTTQTAGTSGGLFGNAGTGATGGGLFGNASNASTNTGGGLFSNTQNANANPSGGLFGSTSTTNTNTGGGLFGNASTANTNTTNPSGGLFSNTTQNTTGGGLFGNASTTAGTSGGGLFGNSSTNTSTTGTGGLFGNAGTTASNAGGGLFGNSSTNTGGGLFGNTASTSTAPSGGLFGNQSQNNQSSLFGGPKPAGSLFGQPSSTGSSLFGQSAQPQPQQQQQQQQGSSLFGTLNQPPAPPTGGLFGTSTLGASTLGTSALGGAFGGAGLGNSILSSRATVIPVQSQPDPQSQFTALMQRIETVKNAWDPSSPQCRFQQYFYNLVDPAQVRLYGRPANATNEDLWQKALRENPDPSCMVPVLAVGFDDLQQRVDAQASQTNQHQEKLKELKTRIDALSQRHEVTNSARVRRAAALQMQLAHRVLRVVQHLHLLIPALRSSSIRPEEEALRAALEEIDEEIRRPGGMGKMRAKLNELWALVDAVRAARERIRQEGTVEWAVVDEDGLTQIAQILAEEQAGLAHVTTILQRDLKDLSIILGVPRKQEDPDVLMGSASALRSSMIR